jgi:hypothetical protein
MSRLRRKFKTLLFSELRIAFFADFVIAIYAQDFTKGFYKKQDSPGFLTFQTNKKLTPWSV